VSPVGIEGGRGDATPREPVASPTENEDSTSSSRTLAKRQCSNVASRLRVAANAVRNADLDRARQVIEELQRDLAGGRDLVVVAGRNGRPTRDR
jgi:hypothetical protein